MLTWTKKQLQWRWFSNNKNGERCNLKSIFSKVCHTCQYLTVLYVLYHAGIELDSFFYHIYTRYALLFYTLPLSNTIIGGTNTESGTEMTNLGLWYFCACKGRESFLQFWACMQLIFCNEFNLCICWSHQTINSWINLFEFFCFLFRFLFVTYYSLSV